MRRRPDAPPLPSQEYWVRTPPGRRTFLSRKDLAEKYGAAQEDLDRVANFARSQGLTVVEASVPRQIVVVSGTVVRMNHAFAVELGRYESSGEQYRGREGFVCLPNDLADIVEGVFGLDNRRVVRPHTYSGPPGASVLTPAQVAQLYNFPTGLNVTGQTIAVLEFWATDGAGNAVTCGYTPLDIQSFFSTPPVTAPNLIPVPVTSTLQRESKGQIRPTIPLTVSTMRSRSTLKWPVQSPRA